MRDRYRRLSQQSAEELLAGHRPPGTPVTDALNAAAAPGHPHEIAGAYAAAQRLAAARRWPVGQPARSRRPVIGWSKAFFLRRM